MKSNIFTLHSKLLSLFVFCFFLIFFAVIHASNVKELHSVKWLDVIGEGGIALITLSWLLVTLHTRPKGKLTTLLFVGIMMVHISMFLDLLDEFYRYQDSHQWMSRFEAIPAVLGLILMSLALFHWHREQQIINNRLIKSERFYREHSFYDFVTGLYSASYMKMQIQSELNHLNNENTPFCVSLIDIKSFEPYLRQHGVTAANTLLSDIGSLIQVNIRKSDLVCRYAGDLYIVLMPNTQLSQSKLINQHVVKMIQQHVLYLSSTSSYSDVHHATIQARQGDDVEHLLQRINALLQQEKKAA